MAKNKKKPTAKKPAAKAARPAPKKSPTPARKHPPASKPAPAPAKAHPSTMEKPSKKTALRDNILKLKQKAPAKPIAFSLDEVRAIAKTVTAKAESTAKSAKVAVKASAAAAMAAALEKPVKPNHIKAASLADILGFNPKRTKAAEVIEEKSVPEKFKRYHKLLIDLRSRLTEGIERHSEETLKRSASPYGWQRSRP